MAHTLLIPRQVRPEALARQQTNGDAKATKPGGEATRPRGANDICPSATSVPPLPVDIRAIRGPPSSADATNRLVSTNSGTSLKFTRARVH